MSLNRRQFIRNMGGIMVPAFIPIERLDKLFFPTRVHEFPVRYTLGEGEVLTGMLEHEWIIKANGGPINLVYRIEWSDGRKEVVGIDKVGSGKLRRLS